MDVRDASWLVVRRDLRTVVRAIPVLAVVGLVVAGAVVIGLGATAASLVTSSGLAARAVCVVVGGLVAGTAFWRMRQAQAKALRSGPPGDVVGILVVPAGRKAWLGREEVVTVEGPATVVLRPYWRVLHVGTDQSWAARRSAS